MRAASHEVTRRGNNKIAATCFVGSLHRWGNGFAVEKTRRWEVEGAVECVA